MRINPCNPGGAVGAVHQQRTIGRVLRQLPSELPEAGSRPESAETAKTAHQPSAELSGHDDREVKLAHQSETRSESILKLRVGYCSRAPGPNNLKNNFCASPLASSSRSAASTVAFIPVSFLRRPRPIAIGSV